MISNKKPQYVFIVSQKYSGSTIFSKILNNHPDIFSPGELFWNYPLKRDNICNCGLKFSECKVWHQINNEAAKVNPDWNNNFELRPIFFRNSHLDNIYYTTSSQMWVEKLLNQFKSSFPNRKVRLDRFAKNHNLHIPAREVLIIYAPLLRCCRFS